MRRLTILIALLALIALALAWMAKRGDPPTPLIQAAGDGDARAIRSLLETGGDPDTPGGAGGWTPLMHAIHENRLEAVRALLEGGADVNAKTGNEDTPLMMAASYGLTEIVRMLLEAGADPYATKRHGLTALDSALIGTSDIDSFTLLNCRPSTVETLLDHAPDLTYYGDLLEVLLLRAKHCPEVDRILRDRKVSRLRPSVRGRR